MIIPKRMKRIDLEELCWGVWLNNPRSRNGLRDMWKAETPGVGDMKGKTISNIAMPNEEDSQDMILFECTDGSVYLMYHVQDCCESVEIEDINGNLEHLIGHELLMSDEVGGESGNDEWGSHTWTFYKFGTVKGYVDIRWYGESNGYYSESVDFIKLK